MEHGIIVHIELSCEQAWALAQLLKRLGWVDCERLSENREETALMIDAAECVRQALAEAGCAPR